MYKKIAAMLMIIMFLGGNVYGKEALDLKGKSAVLIDMESGRVLYDYNKDQELAQASITKLMTYFVFKDYLKSKEIDDSTVVNMGNVEEWSLPSDGSMSGIKSGDSVSIKKLMEALLIVSGNDSAVMMKEIYNGSGGNFIDAMNKKAAELGLNKSKYVNVSGLTDEGSGVKMYNKTTAYETALLGRSIIKEYPEILKITSNQYYSYKNIKLPNTNRLLFDKALSVDGLKTGHTSEAGYCVISTEEHKAGNSEKPIRFIGVVLGAPTDAERFSDSKQLLEYGRENYKYEKLSGIIGENNSQLTVNNEYYKGGVITGYVPEDILLLKGKYEKFQYNIVFNEKLPKKITKGDTIGKIILRTFDNQELSYNLLAKEDYKSVSIIKKVVIYFKHLLK